MRARIAYEYIVFLLKLRRQEQIMCHQLKLSHSQDKYVFITSKHRNLDTSTPPTRSTAHGGQSLSYVRGVLCPAANNSDRIQICHLPNTEFSVGSRQWSSRKWRVDKLKLHSPRKHMRNAECFYLYSEMRVCLCVQVLFCLASLDARYTRACWTEIHRHTETQQT